MKSMHIVPWLLIAIVAVVFAAVPARSIADTTTVSTPGLTFVVALPTPQSVNVSALTFVVEKKAK
jgi:hypothetical protein